MLLQREGALPEACSADRMFPEPTSTPPCSAAESLFCNPQATQRKVFATPKRPRRCHQTATDRQSRSFMSLRRARSTSCYLRALACSVHVAGATRLGAFAREASCLPRSETRKCGPTLWKSRISGCDCDDLLSVADFTWAKVLDDEAHAVLTERACQCRSTLRQHVRHLTGELLNADSVRHMLVACLACRILTRGGCLVLWFTCVLHVCFGWGAKRT